MINWRVAVAGMDDNKVAPLIGQTVEIRGAIRKDLDCDENRVAAIIETSTINGETVKTQVYAILERQYGQVLRRSDIIQVHGELAAGFGVYAAYLWKPTVISVKRPEPGDFFLTLRDCFADAIRGFIPGREAGLALGYLLGIRSGVDEEFTKRLRVVGLSHIIVASGTHLAILIGAARRIFGKLSRFAGLFAALLFILMFIGITGATPSMTRAALASTLGLVAWYYGRKFVPWRILAIVMSLTLMMTPGNLTNLAWILSFASYLSIIIVTPIMTKFFMGEEPPGFLAATLVPSLAAGIVCAPILIYYYGTFSIISILANLLILPTISIVMGLTFGVGMFACSGITFVAATLARIDILILDYHFAIVEFLSTQKCFLISLPARNSLILLLYFPITVVLFWMHRKNKVKSLTKT